MISIWASLLSFILLCKAQDEDNVTLNSGWWPGGYCIGDLMNMPSLMSPPRFPTHGVKRLIDAAHTVAQLNPTTFIGIYYNVYNKSCPIPYIPKVHWAINEYGRRKYRSDSESLSLVRNETTLLVHVRSGDRGAISTSYKSHIMKLSSSFETICLIGGVHADRLSAPENVSKANLNDDFNNITATLSGLGKRVHVRTTKLPDDDFYLMYSAANLLVHKGGFSAIGGLVCKGRVFFANELKVYTRNPEYFKQLNHPTTIDKRADKLVPLGTSDYLTC
jgi:hypothetical protein